MYDVYDELLQKAYNLYIADWCNERNYPLMEVVAACLDDCEYHGEMFVCLGEFEDAEFQDEGYMEYLLPEELLQQYKEL